MVIMAKISKGTLMDQVYLPKNRAGLETGSYVIVKPIEESQFSQNKPFFYGLSYIEPVKLDLVMRIFSIINSIIDKTDNIIITGSFLNKGFRFNDIDIIIIGKSKVVNYLEKKIVSSTGISPHIIYIDNKSLIKGLETDPLYQLMLSKCVSQNRLIYKFKNKPDYKILDLHLLKSKSLTINLDILSGEEKYQLARNMIAIKLFLENRKLSNELLDKEIKHSLKIETEDLKNNIIDKKQFSRNYSKTYILLSNKILQGIKDGSKQE